MLLLEKLLDKRDRLVRSNENEKSRCSINMNEKFTDFVSVVSRTVKRMDRRTDEQTNRRDGEHDGKNSVKKQQSPWTKLVKVNNCLSTAN